MHHTVCIAAPDLSQVQAQLSLHMAGTLTIWQKYREVGHFQHPADSTQQVARLGFLHQEGSLRRDGSEMKSANYFLLLGPAFSSQHSQQQAVALVPHALDAPF